MQPLRTCPHCQAPLVEGGTQCGACGQALRQRTLIGVPGIQLAAPTLFDGAPLALAEQTAIGPPRPADPLWAQLDEDGMAAPTLLDSRPIAALEPEVTPAGGHPALPRPVAEVVSTRPARPALKPVAIARTERDPDRASDPALDRDALAARRIRAATEATERAAQVERRGSVLSLMVIAALAITVAIVAYWMTRFRAELDGDLSVTRTSSGYAVDVGVRTSGPATVHHPGGQRAVDGVARLRFEVASAQMKLGDNRVGLRVVDASGAERVLTLDVMVYYQLRAPQLAAPQPGRPVDVALDLSPGWQITLHGEGAVDPLPGGGVRLRLDADAALAAAPPGHDVVLPIDFTLTGPGGERERFVEKLRLPAPRPPLSVAAPVRGWALPTESVQVVGRAAPDAQLQIAQRAVRADATGRFEARIPLPAPGVHRLRIESLPPYPGLMEIDVRRLTPAEAAERIRAANTALPPAKAAPAYPRLLADDAPTEVFAFEGALLGVQRGNGDAPDAAQVATCVGEGGCVVWAELAAPPLVPVGAPARLVGRLAGRHRYPTRAGTEIDVPRLVSARIVPR